jgi:nicotinamide-nucleotide amidase
MRIEVICTGDEVLGGKTVNTNFAYISQRLEDVGLAVAWETTVGDDRDSLLLAFGLAAERADAVVVNGGLGPTVDDLSQEIAARAAGVELVLSEEWLARMESYFARRSRVMSPSNRKQALLPAGAEILDNPIGTACGFAVTIGRARFFFTPGVPRELRRMIDEQVVPRLLARSGRPGAIFVKRFHSFGIGESHADSLLQGLEVLAPDGGVKLGFRAHYPELETKLTARGRSMDEVRARLAPLEVEVRRRLGNFIVAEDDVPVEAVVLGALAQAGATLAVAETFTSGQVALRLGQHATAAGILQRGVVAPDAAALAAATGARADGAPSQLALAIAAALRAQAGCTHALAVVVAADAAGDGIEFGGGIELAIATATACVSRSARLVGGRDWLRLGAAEMGIDFLRRYLTGLPVDERNDFERAPGAAERGELAKR